MSQAAMSQAGFSNPAHAMAYKDQLARSGQQSGLDLTETQSGDSTDVLFTPVQGKLSLLHHNGRRWQAVKQTDVLGNDTDFTAADEATYEIFQTTLNQFLHNNGTLQNGQKVDASFINYSNRTITYWLAGKQTPEKSIAISVASQNPALKDSIDKVKVIAERVWTGSITPSKPNPASSQLSLGKQSDPVLGATFQGNKMLHFVANKLPTNFHDLDAYLQNLTTAKLMKKKLHAKVKERIKALQEREKTAGPRYKKLIQEDLTYLKRLESQLQDNWEEITLEIVLAYKNKYKADLDSGTTTWREVAGRIENDVNKLYSRQFKREGEGIVAWFKEKVGSTQKGTTAGANMALAFIRAQPDKTRGEEEAQLFNLERSTSKAETFANAFSRYVITAQAIDDTSFNAFLDGYVGDQLKTGRLAAGSLHISPVSPKETAEINKEARKRRVYIAGIQGRSRPAPAPLPQPGVPAEGC